MKRVLVLGGAGFIGSHLCKRLLDEGCHVTAVDSYASGNRENVEALLGNPHFDIAERDICEPFTFDVEQIYHLASPASPWHYEQDPVKTLMTNIQGTVHALELANKTGATLLFTSTSEVYGNAVMVPQPEHYSGNINLADSRACYYEGKRCAEALLLDSHRRKKTNVKIVRLFNTYGPHLNPFDGRVISNFIIQALRGEPVTLYGDGSHTRTFCYVDDLVTGLLLMMHSGAEVTGPVNLGNPDTGITMLKLAELICAATGSMSQIVHKPAPGSPAHLCPDITYARLLLNWSPCISLQEGLEKTIPYFRKTLLKDLT